MLKSISKPTSRSHDLRVEQLSAARQQLIRKLQRLSFGSVHNLKIVSGEPSFNPPPRIVHRRKIHGHNLPRPQANAASFVLKQEWIELLSDLEALNSTTILVIEIMHGLPVYYEYEETPGP